MAQQYRVHDKEKDLILESSDFVLTWNTTRSAAIKKWIRFFEKNFPGRFEIVKVDWDNKSCVENYLKAHNTSILEFKHPISSFYVNGEGEKRTKENEIKEEDGLLEFVLKLIRLSSCNNSVNENEKIETNYSRNRSSIDLWRHAKKFRPDISIFNIMSALFEISHNRENKIVSQYCGTIHRRVFSYTGSNSYSYGNIYHASYNDEYGLTFYDWKDIDKDKK